MTLDLGGALLLLAMGVLKVYLLSNKERWGWAIGGSEIASQRKWHLRQTLEASER